MQFPHGHMRDLNSWFSNCKIYPFNTYYSRLKKKQISKCIIHLLKQESLLPRERLKPSAGGSPTLCLLSPCPPPASGTQTRELQGFSYVLPMTNRQEDKDKKKRLSGSLMLSQPSQPGAVPPALFVMQNNQTVVYLSRWEFLLLFFVAEHIHN